MIVKVQKAFDEIMIYGKDKKIISRGTPEMFPVKVIQLIGNYPKKYFKAKLSNGKLNLISECKNQNW